jgi:hypothetical protein
MNDLISKWGKIITENENRQRAIQKRIDQLKNSAVMATGDENHGDERNDAFFRFIKDVDEVIGYVLMQHDKVPLDDVPLPDNDEMVEAEAMLIDGKRSRRSSKCTLSSFTPQEIEKRAKAMNLMDFPSFVRILNTLNKAGRGALDQQSK